MAGTRPGDRVLDLGCGHGRIAHLLPKGCTYVGMDFSATMIALARAQATVDTDIETTFVVGDLFDAPWPHPTQARFEWVVLRAVLHHIPGQHHRERIVQRAARRLTPDGRLIIANWQFLDIPRLRRRFLDWGKIGLDADALEAGDYLLDWQRDGYGLRYVHWVGEAETRSLAKSAGLSIESLFRADGHQNNLTLYAVLRHPPQTPQ